MSVIAICIIVVGFIFGPLFAWALIRGGSR